MDSFEGRQEKPLTLHKYIYGNSDPVNNADPTGNESIGVAITSISIQIGFRASQFVAAHPVYTALGGIVASVAFPQLEAIPPGHPSPLDEMGQVGRIIRQGIAKGLAKVMMNNHHPLPKFLGGDRVQNYIRIPHNVHEAYHKLLHERLQAKGFPLGGLGGSGNSASDWADYFRANPGSQDKAFEAVLEAARAVDVSFGDEIVKTGTTMSQAAWKMIIEGKFTQYP